MKRAPLLLSLAALVAVLALASLLIGPAGAGPVASLSALRDGEGPLGIVLREIRAPRAVLGVMLGISLGLSGAALQGYLRNPLAEPGLIGISAAAALGAVIAIQAGVSTLGLGVPAAGLTGALADPAGGGERWVGAGADSRRHRGVGTGRGADRAGAEPVAEPVCRL